MRIQMLFTESNENLNSQASGLELNSRNSVAEVHKPLLQALELM